MEAGSSPETLPTIYELTLCYNRYDPKIHQQPCQNLKSHTTINLNIQCSQVRYNTYVLFPYLLLQLYVWLPSGRIYCVCGLLNELSLLPLLLPLTQCPNFNSWGLHYAQCSEIRITANPDKTIIYSLIFSYMFQPQRPSSVWIQEWKNIYTEFTWNWGLNTSQFIGYLVILFLCLIWTAF